QDNEFDLESAIVFNQLKHQFEVDVGDETLRQLDRKNPYIKNEKEFKDIYEEVHDMLSGYSAIVSCYDTETGEFEKYEESEECKYLVNKESLQQYREYNLKLSNEKRK
ncbi:2280_t:CDS:1, partial [Cetraspora pellucida]